MKLRFGLRSCAGLFLAGAGFFLPTPGLFASPPILPNINTNNVITITNAPYNAVGDGATDNTLAISNAIVQAAKGGNTNDLFGGTVKIPAPGVFLCGITVAPIIPMATYRLSRLRRGASPVSSSLTAGLAQKISTQKQAAITAISVKITSSIVRMPKLWNQSSSSVSAEVIRTPASRGMWNSRLSPMAAPMTSARSQAATAISQSAHSARLTARG